MAREEAVAFEEDSGDGASLGRWRAGVRAERVGTRRPGWRDHVHPRSPTTRRPPVLDARNRTIATLPYAMLECAASLRRGGRRPV